MTIQRQYSLPNFRLVLEGFPEDPAAAAQGLAPVMSNLVNVECYVAGLEQPLRGGMDFLNSLVMAVSKYAQAFLSGVPSSEPDINATGGVSLEKIAPDRHRLVVKPTDENTGTAGALMQVELTTPQLFDLVEAVDQFLADAGTLPQMRLQLQPVSRKYSPSASNGGEDGANGGGGFWVRCGSDRVFLDAAAGNQAPYRTCTPEYQ
ncbi:DUF4335 domain-containing protein [[Phormidium] sp. ETS-05]|uniref:DUF4335 domain-containing protein n=1 Tax=[Phormidium] sp. ETS-05 TaxID=222819 RepID=UPI0018EF2652|nr:DUF4335 domain-containing protein [[Phormidium] sp. ETS-05]